jgi:hypothetical protein
MKAEGTVGAPTCFYYNFLFPAMPKPDMLEIFKKSKMIVFFSNKNVFKSITGLYTRLYSPVHSRNAKLLFFYLDIFQIF